MRRKMGWWFSINNITFKVCIYAMRAGDNGVAKLVLGKLKSIPLSPLLKRLRKEKKSVRTSEVCLFIDLYNLFIYNRAYSCFDSFFVLVLLFSFLSSFPLLPSLSCLFLLLFFFPLRLRHDIHSLPTQWKEGTRWSGPGCRLFHRLHV